MLEDWMSTLTEYIGDISGIEQAHDYTTLPASIEVFPAAIILPVSGTQEFIASGGVALHYIDATLFFASQILPEAMTAAVPYIGKMREAILKEVTLDGLVSYCLPVEAPDRWYEGPGAIAYGDKTLLGIKFHLIVKEVESLTISA